MKSLDLNFTQRLGLMNFLGGCTGADGLKVLAALWRVSEKVRFSDSENGQIVKRDAGNGMLSFEPPKTEGFGERTVEIEDGDATVLLEQLEKGAGRLRVLDMAWVGYLRERLALDPTRVDAGLGKRRK